MEVHSVQTTPGFIVTTLVDVEAEVPEKKEDEIDGSCASACCLLAEKEDGIGAVSEKQEDGIGGSCGFVLWCMFLLCIYFCFFAIY